MPRAKKQLPESVIKASKGEYTDMNDKMKSISMNQPSSSIDQEIVLDDSIEILGDLDTSAGISETFELPTLYKKGDKDKINVWKIGFDGKNLYMYSGEQKSFEKNKYEKSSYPVIVNSSGRDLLEQAKLDAHARWKAKIDKNGYSEQLIESTILDKTAMLASPWEPNKNQIKFWPVYVQPKLDGVRMRARLIEDQISMKTRGSQDIQHFVSLRAELRRLLEVISTLTDDQFMLDGELYTWKISFERINGSSRTTRQPSKDEDLIDYHIFDLVMKSNPPYDVRYELLQKAFSIFQSNRLFLVKCDIANNKADIHSYHDAYVQQGYEGIIIRNIANGSSDPARLKLTYYIDTRGMNMYKYKQFVDEEFEVVGATEGKGSEEGCIIWILKTSDGQQFQTRPRGDITDPDSGRKKLYSEYLSNPGKFIGRKYRVKFQKYSEYGVPLNGSGIDFIDDR
jgi:hypothetical protein